MVNINQLFSLSFFLISISDCLSHPVFGTKRYGRANGLPPSHHIPSYAQRAPLQPSTLNHYPSPSYYPDTLKYPPYSPDYDMEYYYPAEPTYTYPVPPYYPAAPPPAATANADDDNLKYSIYQSLMPFYYDERRPAYGYYGPESYPLDSVPEDMQQEGASDDRGLPIGQETWFEDSMHQSETSRAEQESMAEANAAFLQNLILSQMYNDAQNRESAAARRRNLGIEDPSNNDVEHDDFAYNEAVTRAGNEGYYSDDYEDEDVKELKSLVKKTKGESTKTHVRVPRGRDGEKIYYGKQMNDVSSWDRASSNKRSVQYGKIMAAPMKRKPYSSWAPSSFTQSRLETPNVGEEALTETSSEAEEYLAGSSTTRAVTVTVAPTTPAPDFDARRGQKEVPLLRPAIPTRLPLVADETVKSAEGSNASVYETIKQLLSMEEDLRQDVDENVFSQPQKRFVSNEDSLVDQLGSLRKLAA